MTPTKRAAAELEALIPLCRAVHADAARRAARQARDRIDTAGVADARAGSMSSSSGGSGSSPTAWSAVSSNSSPRRACSSRRCSTSSRTLGSSSRRCAAGSATRCAVIGRSPTPAPHANATRPTGLVQLLHAGASVDPGRLLNESKPSVRIVVNARTLASGDGIRHARGSPRPTPARGDPRRALRGLPARSDSTSNGACLDLGRDERLFTAKQKAVLAIRDGGCMDPDCTRPPSWTEAHHIDHWHRDDGRTDLADGILLCRRDHLRYHNEGWEVRRDGTTYWLIPPPRRRPRADTAG